MPRPHAPRGGFASNLCYFCSYRYESLNIFERFSHCITAFSDIVHGLVSRLTEAYTRRTTVMGVQKKTRKFATVKRIIGQRDARLKKNQLAQDAAKEGEKKKKDEVIREVYVSMW